MSRVNPFFDNPPERIQLDSAPLVRVLAQVTFPPIPKISEPAYIGNFQEAIRHIYPFLEKEIGQSISLRIDDGGMQVKPTEEIIWRLFDAQRIWRVSLSQTQISIETHEYSSRKDFLERMKALLFALADTIRPSFATRVGFRYVNRITETDDIANLSNLICPELIGVINEAYQEAVLQSISDARCNTQEGTLIARWGLLPPNMSHDPDMIVPTPTKSWMLDIDSFQENKPVEVGFDTDALIDRVNLMANRAYAFFRWSVTDDFLERFRAKK